MIQIQWRSIYITRKVILCITQQLYRYHTSAHIYLVPPGKMVSTWYLLWYLFAYAMMDFIFRWKLSCHNWRGDNSYGETFSQLDVRFPGVVGVK